MQERLVKGERLSFREKNKNKQEWYRLKVDRISQETLPAYDKMRIKVNYDLFNNKIVHSEFKSVIDPMGLDMGPLPAQLQNRDIVSGKIKALLGMEMQRPFSYKVFTTNPEATTEREKQHFAMLKQSVIDMIMGPIRQQLQQEMLMAQQGMNPEGMSEEQMQQTQAKMQEIEAEFAEKEKQMTPEEVNRYMEMDYQDPAEALSSQLLEYLTQHLRLKEKFSDMFKHALLTARSVMYVGVINDEPQMWVIDPSRFNFSKSADTPYIEDGEWAVCEYYMSPSQIISYFGDDLKNEEIDMITDESDIAGFAEENDIFLELASDPDMGYSGIRVCHCVWKSLRKLGILTYMDENGEEQQMVVDESYRIEKDLGEVKVDWHWIPECYEGWKICIGQGIYVQMRPVPGQYKDLDNIRQCKLPYYGMVYDSHGSTETSLMDRIKTFQYMYNILIYRLELLMASDKGKKVLMNINSVPDSLGIDIKKFQYFMESTPWMWFNPNEEGGMPQDANNVAKVIDLSLASDIKKYIEIAEYVRQQCGRSVGITEQVEGQIGQYEAVRNTNQAIIQSSYILESYFNCHERCKVNALQALLETAKVCYSQKDVTKLTYILDDLSKKVLEVDGMLLDNSTFGIFVSSSSKATQTKELIQQLSHAALQTQTVEFSDIISILQAESVPEAEAILKAAQKRREEAIMAQQKQQAEQQQQMAQQQMQMEERKHEMAKELVILKEEERRKSQIANTSIMGASFNPGQDGDNDGMNDFLEIGRLQLEQYAKAEDLKMRAMQMEFDQDMAIAKQNELAKTEEAKRKQMRSTNGVSSIKSRGQVKTASRAMKNGMK